MPHIIDRFMGIKMCESIKKTRTEAQASCYTYRQLNFNKLLGSYLLKMKKRSMASSVVEKIFPKISYIYYSISFLSVNKEE